MLKDSTTTKKLDLIPGYHVRDLTVMYDIHLTCHGLQIFTSARDTGR